jgi:predicted O-methyltransferase YrrM
MWFSTSRIRPFFLARLSRPAEYRPIYQAIRRHGLRRIVELGVGHGDRALRMIEMAAFGDIAENVVYTGIDLFEMRAAEDAPGLSLKLAHRKLVTSGAKIRLLPGDSYSALSRAANMLGVADLVVIAADPNKAALERSWYYIERLLHEPTHIFMQNAPADGKEGTFRLVPHAEVRQLAAAVAPRRRAA